MGAPDATHWAEAELRDLVERFTKALHTKLVEAEEKHGWNGHWRRPDWREELLDEMLRHIAKGDPRDVAAYCAFAWHHGWQLAIPAGLASSLEAERDTALLQRDAVKSSLEIAQTLAEQNQTRIHALEGLLREASRFIQGFEGDELQRSKHMPNGIDPLLAQIRTALGLPVRTQDAA